MARMPGDDELAAGAATHRRKRRTGAGERCARDAQARLALRLGRVFPPVIDEAPPPALDALVERLERQLKAAPEKTGAP